MAGENQNYYLNNPIEGLVAPTENPSINRNIASEEDLKHISSGMRNYMRTPSIYTPTIGDVVNRGMANYSENTYNNITYDDVRALREDQNVDVQDILANRQSGWEMAGHAVVNNLVIAGTEAVLGTLSLPLGIIEAAAYQDASKLWDNEASNAAADIQKASQEEFAIHRGKTYNNMSTLERLGTGIFWADMVQNLGYTEGMLVPGMGAGALLKNAPRAIARIGGAMTGAMTEAATEAVQSRNDAVQNKTAIAQQEYTRRLENATSQNEIDALTHEYYNTISQIEEDATKVGNMVYAANTALLTASNALQFGNLIERGFGTARRFGTVEGIKRVGNEVVADTKKKAVAKTIGKQLLNGVAEGTEEMSQNIISSMPEYYTDYNSFNNSMFNPDKIETTNDFLDAFGKSIASRMQDQDAWTEFASGFFTGILGVPTITKNSNGKFRPTLENNTVVESFRAASRAGKNQQLVDEVNARIQDDKQFKAYYEGINRHLSMEDSKNLAVDNADQYAYENANSAQMISDVMMFQEAGQLNYLKELVNNSIDTSDEGIQSLIEQTTKDGNGPFVVNGNPLSVEEVRGLVKQKQDWINKKIDSIAKKTETFSSSYPALSEDGLKSVVFLSSQLDDHLDRFAELSKNNYDALKSIYEKTSPEFKANFEKDGRTFPTYEEYLSGEIDSKFVEDLVNDPNNTTPYDQKEKAVNDFADVIKLSEGIAKLNEEFKKAVQNPEKTNKAKEEAQAKAQKKAQAKQNVMDEDNINQMTPSELNQKVAEEGLDLDDLAKQFEGNETIANAKQIEKAEKAMQKELNKARQAGEITEAEARDIEAALAASKAVANSEEELLNTQAAAFEDSNIYYNEEDPSLQGRNPEEIEIILEGRKENAKSKINELAARVKDTKETLNNMPSNKRTNNNNQSKSYEPQGAVKTIDSIRDELNNNEERKLYDRYLKDILKYVQKLADSNNNAQEIWETVQKTQSYNNLIGMLSEVQQQWVNDYIVSEIKKAIENSKNTGRTNTQQKTEETVNQKQETPEDLSPNTIHSTTENEAKEETLEQSKQVITPEDTTAEFYEYWKPTTTYLPIHPMFGDNTPFYKIVEKVRTINNKLKNGEPLTEEEAVLRNYKPYKGVFNYSDNLLNQIIVIGKYLEEHQAYKMADTGKLNIRTKVHFKIDPKLNEDAGRVVILMVDENDGVIGDIMDATDPKVIKQVGLLEFINRVTEEWEKTDKTQPFTYDKETVTVTKMMVGKVAYSTEFSSLNEIYEGSDVPLTIGIYKGTDVTVDTNDKVQERTIINPLKPKEGKPYILVPTVTGMYITVPFIMKRYSSETKDTALGKAIHDLLSLMPTKDNTNVARDIKAPLMHLLGLEDLHINYSGDKVEIRFTPYGEGAQTVNITLNKNSENFVEELEDQLIQSQVPFQISTKYINSTYNGKNYNEMIGEIAEANIEKGQTRTISNWFITSPLVAKNTEGKTVPPSNKVRSENTANPEVHELTYTSSTTHKKMKIFFNKRTGALTDETGKEYSGEKANLMKAWATGQLNRESMTKPYLTNWGMYDPVHHKFISKETVQNNTQYSTLEHDTSPTALEIKRELYRQANLSSVSGLTSGLRKGYRRYAEGVNGSNLTGTKYEGMSYDDFVNLMVPRAISALETIVRVWNNPTIESFEDIFDLLTDEEVEALGMLDGFLIARYRTLFDESRNTNQSSTQLKNTESSTVNPSQQESTTETTKPSFINTQEKETVWNALSEEHQSKLANLKGKTQENTLRDLIDAYDPAEGNFVEDVDDILSGPKYRKENKAKKIKVLDQKKELAWLNKVLPQLSKEDKVRIYEGLIEIVGKENAEYAWGKFEKGIITISDIAASGTLYHEAFHAVVNMLMSDKEKLEMFKAAQEKWGNLKTLELEENLAEAFRRYVQLEESPILGTLVKWFRKLKHLVQSLIGKEPYLNNLFYRINNGKYREQALHSTDATRNREEEYTSEMQSIKDKAIADGTFLKAPNGNPTNLNERQWLQVRTGAFKNWFGDWENSPENASKVVDENGEPLVVYHGGKYKKGEKFSAFDASKSENRFWLSEKVGNKSFFTNNDYLAYKMSQPDYYQREKENLEGSVYEVFLNLKNPLVLNASGRRADFFIEEHEQKLKDSEEIIVNNVDEDGINVTDYIVSNPNQIKSATDNIGTFSIENNDIRYRKVDDTVADYTNKIENLKKQKEAFRQLGDIIKKIPSEKAVVFYRGEKRISKYPYTNISYSSRTEAESHIPAEFKDYFKVYENKGKYSRYFKYAKNKSIAVFEDKIKEVDKEIENLEKAREKSYNKELSKERIEYLKGNESESYSIKNEEADYREIEQYHRDKLEYGNLSKEQKAYLTDRKLTIEDYNRMTTTEKNILWKCR